MVQIPDDVLQTSFWGSRSVPKINWPGRFHREQVRDLADTIARWKIDVTYDRLFHTAMINGPASMRTKCPRISTIVSPPSHDLPHAEKRFVWLKRRLLARSYLQAERLLAVSSTTADDASHYYHIPRDRFEVVPSAVDLVRIDALASESSEPLPKECFHVISIGRLSSEKGHATLLAGFARFIELTHAPSLLHIVGDGPLRSELESQAEHLAIRQITRFYGHLDNPYALLSQCNIVVLPSHYEGMPNVVLEGMACRVPVLATATAGAASELLGNGTRGVIIDAPRPDWIASALLDCWKHPAVWLSRIESARRYVEQHHDLPRWLAAMESILLQTAIRQRSE